MGGVLAALVALAAVSQAPKPTTAERLAEHVKDMVAESRVPAEKALKQLALLATEKNFKSLGFESLDEVRGAELGKPLPVIIVRLDELREFKPGDDPYAILHPIPKVMYPVNVKGETRSGIEVEKFDGSWEAASLGMAATARRHAEALKKQAEKDEASLFFVIKVLALNRTYLAYQTDRGARVIEVRPNNQESKVESRPAAEVLAELVAQAKEHKGDFR